MKNLITFLIIITFSKVYSQNGNVGINTSNPLINLSIGDSDTGIKQIQDNELAIVTNNINRIKILQNGKVGINQDTPSKMLDINANNDFIKIANLNEISTNNFDFLVYDKITGDITKKNIRIKAGQVLRVPIVNKDYAVGNNYLLEYNAAASNPTGLSSFPNYINTITEDNITFPVNISTNQINNIPPGTYKIILRIAGGFTAGNNNQKVDAGIEVSTDGINWVDYSFSEGIVSGFSIDDTVDKTGYFSDIIKLTASDNYIRFKINVMNNSFNLESALDNVYRNVLILERL